ncbi:MAG: efflux RND transporter permease subunit, partial [Bacteroidota bacterium]
MNRGDLSILLVHVAICLVGWCLLPKLGVAPAKKTAQAQFKIQAMLPGATPQQVETQLTSRLESAIAGLEGVDKIYSVSSHGVASLSVHLEDRENMNFTEQDFRRRLRKIHAELPPRTPFPRISVPNGQRPQPLLTYYLVTDLPLAQAADSLRHGMAVALAMLPDLSGVQVAGEPRKQLTVTYREENLRALGVRPIALEGWLRDWGREQGLGRWTQQGKTQTISLTKSPPNLATLRNARFPIGPQRTVALRELVHLEFTSLPAGQIFRFNGSDALKITFFAEPQSSPWLLSEQVEEKLPVLGRYLSKNTSFELVTDHTQELRFSIYRAILRAILAVVLVLLIVALITRNAAYLATLIACLLASLGICWVMMWWLEISLNVYTLAALSIGFGLMADQMIMAVDTNRRYGRLAPLAVAAATLTTLAALLVIAFLPFELRKLLSGFGITLTIMLLASFSVASLLVPALWRALGQPGISTEPQHLHSVPTWVMRGYTWLLQRRRWVWLACILAFGLPVYLLPPQMNATGTLNQVYNATLGHQTYQEQIRPWVDRLLGGTSRLFYLKNRLSGPRSEFSKETRLVISATLPPNFTPTAAQDLIAPFEQLFQPHLDTSQVRRYFTEVSSADRVRLTVWFSPQAIKGGLLYRLQTQASRL